MLKVSTTKLYSPGVPPNVPLSSELSIPKLYSSVRTVTLVLNRRSAMAKRERDKAAEEATEPERQTVPRTEEGPTENPANPEEKAEESGQASAAEVQGLAVAVRELSSQVARLSDTLVQELSRLREAVTAAQSNAATQRARPAAPTSAVLAVDVAPAPPAVHDGPTFVAETFAPPAAELALTQAAVAVAPGQVVYPPEPPMYKMIRGRNVTIEAIWLEYIGGVDGKQYSVAELEKRYDTKWRHQPSETKLYCLRKKIYDEVKYQAKKMGWPELDAAKRMDTYRLSLGNTLTVDQLIKQLQIAHKNRMHLLLPA